MEKVKIDKMECHFPILFKDKYQRTIWAKYRSRTDSMCLLV